jgi:Lysylphosphatidylglycerol synthase TM region
MSRSRILPVLVSVALLGYLASTIDLRAAARSLTLDIGLRFALPLLAWNFATLLIEAHSLHRVTAAVGHAVSRTSAARIKSASYLLSLVHYAAGATVLAFLIRRRIGGDLAFAASTVFVIALLDIGSVAGLAALSAALLPTVGAGLRTGLLLGMLATLAAGLFVLRSSWPFGSAAESTGGSLGGLASRTLERLRELPILHGARTLPIARLAELLALRLVFVCCYVALMAGLFRAFEVEVPLASLPFKVAILLAVSALPIAAAGLGTAQLAFVKLFSGAAPDAVLLSMSIALSIGVVLARSSLGLVFSRELVREGIAAQSSMRDASTRSSRDASRRR